MCKVQSRGSLQPRCVCGGVGGRQRVSHSLADWTLMPHGSSVRSLCEGCEVSHTVQDVFLMWRGGMHQ